MSVSMEKARKLAKRILADNKNGISYRDMVSKEFNGMKAGTLNRFAKSKGKYIPKDKKILSILGLITEVKRYEKPDFIKQWGHLPVDERHKVIKEYLKWKDKLK